MRGSTAPVNSEGFRASEVVGRRIGAALIDIVVLTVLWAIIALVASGVADRHGHLGLGTNGAVSLAWIGGDLLYFFVLEWAFGRTLGKQLLGLRVVRRRDGQSAGAAAVAGRTVLRLIDGLPAFYLVGFVVLLLSRRRTQRLGDLVSGTTVVEAR